MTHEPRPNDAPTRLKWPQVESATNHRAYRIKDVVLVARPDSGETMAPVDKVSNEEARRPRECVGYGEDDIPPKGWAPVYWCRSCDRRVPNGATPFCRRHREQRRQYSRDLRRARAKARAAGTVPFRIDHLEAVQRDLDVLEARREFAQAAPDRAAYETRAKQFSDTVETFIHQVRGVLPSTVVTVPLRKLKDPWA